MVLIVFVFVTVETGDAQIGEMGESVTLWCKATGVTSLGDWEWYKAASDPEQPDVKLEEGEKYAMDANSTNENELTIKDTSKGLSWIFYVQYSMTDDCGQSSKRSNVSMV